MPYFSTEQEVYEYLGRLIEDLADSPGVGGQVKASNTTIRFSLEAPRATITVALSDSANTVELGPSSLPVDLVLSLDADVAHMLFLGLAEMVEAAQSGRLTARGETERILPFWPTIRFAAAPRYRQLLTVAGRTDLLDG